MTAFQKILIAVALAGAILAGVYQGRVLSRLRGQVQSLTEEPAQFPALRKQVQELQRERDLATNALAALVAENTALKQNPTDLLKLRGEVGQLSQEKAHIGSTSAGDKMLASPALWKMLRDQNKAEASRLYRKFAQAAKLSPGQTEQFNNLLADDAMENANQLTALLRDKPTLEQLDQIVAAQDAALAQKVKELLGPDALAQYQEYTRNLIGVIGAEQFKGRLTGSNDAKEAKARQLSQALQESAQAALADTGLPPDYQPVPELNFRSVASEQGCGRNLKLLDAILQRTAARAAAFLSPEELAKFQDYRTTGLEKLKAELATQRAGMAPIAQ